MTSQFTVNNNNSAGFFYIINGLNAYFNNSFIKPSVRDTHKTYPLALPGEPFMTNRSLNPFYLVLGENLHHISIIQTLPHTLVEHDVKWISFMDSCLNKIRRCRRQWCIKRPAGFIRYQLLLLLLFRVRCNGRERVVL